MPSSASSISSPPPLPLYCRAFLLLLPPFSVAVTVVATVSIFSSYLHHILFDFMCCPSLSLFVVVLSPFSSSRSLKHRRHRFPTLSDLALSYIRLLRASAMDLMDTLLLCRSITNVQSGHCHRRHHRCRRCRRHRRRGSGIAAPVSTPPAMAAASTAAYVVVVFAPAPLRAALPLPCPSPSRSSRSSPCWRRHRPALKDLRPP